MAKRMGSAQGRPLIYLSKASKCILGCALPESVATAMLKVGCFVARDEFTTAFQRQDRASKIHSQLRCKSQSHAVRSVTLIRCAVRPQQLWQGSGPDGRRPSPVSARHRATRKRYPHAFRDKLPPPLCHGRIHPHHQVIRARRTGSSDRDPYLRRPNKCASAVPSYRGG